MSKPSNVEIKKYLQEHKPLGKKVKINKVSFLGGGNHHNYKTKTNIGDFVVRVSRLDGLGSGVLFDIPDEFALLKLLENNKVAPKAIAVDLERFSMPLLIEECVNGKPYTSFKKVDSQKLEAIVDLIVRVSRISLNEKEFPFRFSYNYYNTNIKAWDARLKEISKLAKTASSKNFVKEANKIIKTVSKILLENQQVLDRAKKSFIYNDVHAGNIFWFSNGKKALFIDWQKVSIGDPAFMLAVFALAFENKVDMNRADFFDHVIHLYEKKTHTKNLKKLFWLRILEREVANMIWVVWAILKQGQKLSFSGVGEYGRYVRTSDLIKNFPY